MKHAGGRPPQSRDKIDAVGIDQVCEWIVEGESLTAIAKKIGVAVSTLLTWAELDTDRSARVREARTLAARIEDAKALQVIEEASDPFSLSKAKEIAHHRRWRAAKFAPKDYGEKVALGGADDLPAIKQSLMVEFVGVKTGQ